MNRFTVALVLGLLGAVFPAAAQLTEVSLDERVDAAALIVEATVVKSTPFWNPDGTRILTANRLQVHKVFKLSGLRLDEVAEIDLLTLGGTIGNRRHEVFPELSLRPGRTGMFFVEQRAEFAGLNDVWLPATGPLGFVGYDEFSGQARDPFRAYPDLQEDLYEPIRVRTGQPFSVIGEPDEARPSETRRGPGPVITSFSPNPVSGGVGEVLTINGSGFGAYTGSANVVFDDPDDGSGGMLVGISAFHVVAWSDSQVRVLVPDDAGTGSFFVRDSAGADGLAPSNLTVDYALREIIQADRYRVFQEDEDGRGGYTFLHSTATASNGVDFTSIADAVSRFDESLELWRCATGWTAEVDGTTTVAATGDDGVNIVAFDNDADPLPGGVLGRAGSYYTGCGSPLQWHVQGLDIRFRRDGAGVNWYFGADTAGQMFGEYDFMSVAAHEVGHAVQHGHVNNGGDMMFWSITNGQAVRTLSAANIAGGQDIMAYSAGRTSACAGGMRGFDCSVAPTARFTGSPLGVCGAGATVDFHDLSYDGPTSWAWNFGDTGSSAARNPSHNYVSTGIYDVSLDVTNGSGSDSASADDYVVVTNAPATACAPTFTGYNNCCGMGPVNVTLNTIDHSTQTHFQGDPQFDDFSCSQFTVLEPSMAYPITVTNGSSNDEVVRVYIDWDNDGTFAGPELVLDSAVGAKVHNGTVNVPAAPVLDTALRMRVLSDFVGAPISGPCENIEYGQVEDYSVLVQQAAGVPGRIADNSLRIDKNATAPLLDLTWGVSCGAGAVDYSVHEGQIGLWYSHTQKDCNFAGTQRTVSPAAGSRYFLVVPNSAAAEGSYGATSSGLERPVSTTVCIAAQDTTVCP